MFRNFLNLMVNKQDIFVGLVVDQSKATFAVYLINPTERYYERVRGYTGGYYGSGPSVVHTHQSSVECGKLKAHGYVLLEQGDLSALDGVVWYWLDCYHNLGPVEKFQFQFPRYASGYSLRKTILPVINETGLRIDLLPRLSPYEQYSPTIDERLSGN